MRVHRPTDNIITGEYTLIHRAYDFSGIGPDNVRAGKNGTIVERVDQYNTSWRNYGVLTTRDYGNYIRIKHDDGTFELHAHLLLGSSFVVGTKVKAGQTVARIGNTGNSSGKHLHSEYENTSNINVEAEFYTEGGVDMNEIEQLKRERDNERNERNKNWDLYQATLKELETVKKELETCKNRPTGTTNPKAEALLKAVKEAVS